MGRRTETTQYLKVRIADALIQLMNDAPIEKIRVQEITESAGVGRMTWFRYFGSKSDALEFKLEQLWKEWIDGHPCSGRIGSYEHALWFFSFWYSIRPLLSLLYRQNQYDVLLRVFLLYASIVEGDLRRERYHEMFFAYGMLGIVVNWTATGFQETPEKLAALLPNKMMLELIKRIACSASFDMAE